MNKIQKIRYAIYNNPLLIGALLKDTSIKKGIIYSEMKKVLPCKIGIEFELSGDFRSGFIKKYCKDAINYKPTNSKIPTENPIRLEPPIKSRKNSIDKMIAKFYKVFDVSIDNYYDDEHITEVRICLRDFHQLKGLYLMMQDMVEFCKLHEGGGIHIHVDISMYKLSYKKTSEIQGYISNRLDDVAEIFPKYKGKYNKKKVGIKTKATWVNISRLNTLEFRIAPLTFNYVDLIKWIHGVVKFRQEVIHYCRLKSNYTPSESESSNGRTEAEDIEIGNVLSDSYIIGNSGVTSSVFTTPSDYTSWHTASSIRSI